MVSMIRLFPLAAKAKDRVIPGISGNMLKAWGKNLSGHESLTPVEARTEAEKFTEADRLERAA